ncbi:UNVERIFIED_CONTAM: hypothetical protein ABID98_003220 [Brevibacillus sp. OAP136]
MVRKANGVKSGEAFTKGSTKAFPIALATLLVATPFLSIPKAYAVTDVSVDADDSDVAGEDSDYTIKFTPEEDLASGDSVTIYFPEEFSIDEDVSKSDIDVNGDTPKKVEFDDYDNSITITLNDDYSADDEIEINIAGVITNPDDADDYEIEVGTSEDKNSDTASIEITEDDSSSSSDDEFNVSIGDDEEDTETTYELGDIDLGKNELEKGKWVSVIFPDDSMVPDDIDTSDVEINGYEVSDIDISGDKVDLKVPSKADTDDTLDINFMKDAGITNPSEDDNYTIKVKYNGKTYESETFDITGSSSSSSSSSSSGSTSLSVDPDDSTVGAKTSYTIEGKFGSKKLQSSSQIKLEFPSSVSIPSIFVHIRFHDQWQNAKKRLWLRQCPVLDHTRQLQLDEQRDGRNFERCLDFQPENSGNLYDRRDGRRQNGYIRFLYRDGRSHSDTNANSNTNDADYANHNDTGE